MRRTPPFGEAALKPDEFRLLRDLFAARTGLQFGPESRFALERRLRERLLVLKLSTFAEYHHYLRFGAHAADEWDEAIDLLTTNETYFFREERQLRAFQLELLPMLQTQARARRRLAIWSAGCSTGEEAYTIAILVQQSNLFPRRTMLEPGLFDGGLRALGGAGEPTRFDASGDVFDRGSPSDSGPGSPWEVRIYGSDISRRCVAAARRGVYTESSFRSTRADTRRAFFVEQPDGWRVSEPIRQVCHFGQMNLLDVDRSRVLSKADAIFCRNVLIYFDARARKAAIQVLYDRLRPGGVLLLGHSESLLNVSTAFELLHLRDDLVYRKPLSAAGSDPAPDEST